MKIIDVNAGFGFWPCQQLSSDTLAAIDRSFERAGIDEVWLSAIESILYPEPDRYDFALFEALAAWPRFRPVKTVNPLLGNWLQSLTRAEQECAVAAIKLFPSYHGYSLSDEQVGAVCEHAARAGIPVLIAIRLNDERNQPSFLQVAPVRVEEIVALAGRHEKTRIIALGAYNNELPLLASGRANLLSDISFLDGAGVLERAAEVLSPERLVFGSHEAFLHAMAARLKLQFSRLPEADLRKIAAGNLSFFA